MQSYTAIPSSQSLQSSLSLLLNNDLTALSSSSGAAFPTANLQIGMLCYRTDINQLYYLQDTAPTWIPIVADRVAALSAATTLNSASNRMLFNVQAATAAYNITLPAAADGLFFEFNGTGGNGTYPVNLIVPTGGGTTYLPDGTTVAAGTAINIDLALAGQSVRIWSVLGAWFLQTLGGKTIGLPATALNEAAVYSQLGNFNGVISGIAAAETLPNSAWGQAVQVTASGITVTLPAGGPASGLAGGLMRIFADFTDAGVLSIAADANHYILAADQGLTATTAGTVLSLRAGEYVDLLWRGAEIDAIGGSWRGTNSQNLTYQHPINVPNAIVGSHAANLSQLEQGIARNGQNVVTGSATLTAANAGQVITFNGTAAATITLPAANAAAQGLIPLVIKNITPYTLTIAAPTGDTLETTVSSLLNGQTLAVWNDGNTVWIELWSVAGGLWEGSNKTVSTAAPSGGNNGDFWFQY